jgi:hypothetical protein
MTGRIADREMRSQELVTIIKLKVFVNFMDGADSLI